MLFCAASTGRAMIMPLMTTGAAGSCGVFPQRWEAIINQISALLGSESTVKNVVVSSFSSGTSYSHQFRQRAGLSGRLIGVIDLDGIIPSFGSFSSAINGPAGGVARANDCADHRMHASATRSATSVAVPSAAPVDELTSTTS